MTFEDLMKQRTAIEEAVAQVDAAACDLLQRAGVNRMRALDSADCARYDAGFTDGVISMRRRLVSILRGEDV